MISSPIFAAWLLRVRSFRLPFRVSMAFAVLVLAGVVCLLPAQAEPTFQQWTDACGKLPANRVLGGRLPPKALLPLKEFQALSSALDQFLAISTNGPLAGKTNWVGRVPKQETFFNTGRGWFMNPEVPFEPFAQKLVLPAGSQVFLQGDLHGDIHSLVAVLKRLNERQWLEGFKLRRPECRMVFLGDYTDRGLYGVEVLYTLMRLKLANPDQVYFARGNHEDLNLVARYGFLAEGRGKYGREFDAARILRAYDFLPVVIYLGLGQDFVQLCHGGMEPGYAPAALLASPGDIAFELLGELRQADFLKKHPNWLSGDAPSGEEAARFLKNFVPMAPTTPAVLGFMWNDFTVFSDEPSFAHNPDRAFVYGHPSTRYWLAQAGGSKARVRAIIRGHQHSGISNPLMRRLVASQGLFRHWQEAHSPSAQAAPPAALAGKLEGGQERRIPEGSVWTFNVAPDSVYGLGCDYGFATFGILELGAEFGAWKIAVETVQVSGR